MFSIALVLLSFNSAFAGSCDFIKSHNEFYLCSLEKHPKAEISKLQVDVADAGIEKASQLKNPEVNVKSVSGSVSGESTGSAEVSAAVGTFLGSCRCEEEDRAVEEVLQRQSATFVDWNEDTEAVRRGFWNLNLMRSDSSQNRPKFSGNVKRCSA